MIAGCFFKTSWRDKENKRSTAFRTLFDDIYEMTYPNWRFIHRQLKTLVQSSFRAFDFTLCSSQNGTKTGLWRIVLTFWHFGLRYSASPENHQTFRDPIPQEVTASHSSQETEVLQRCLGSTMVSTWVVLQTCVLKNTRVKVDGAVPLLHSLVLYWVDLTTKSPSPTGVA